MTYIFGLWITIVVVSGAASLSARLLSAVPRLKSWLL
jgi:hypothetical protein